MNVPITNSISPAPQKLPSSTENQSFQAASGLQDSAPRLVTTEKDLDKVEIQGVKISLGEQQMIRAIDRAIKALEGPSTMFEMKVHEQTKTIVVKVLNKETGELIREIPPEKTLDMIAKMMEIAGILIDEKV